VRRRIFSLFRFRSENKKIKKKKWIVVVFLWNERTTKSQNLMTRAFFLSLSGSGASCVLGLSGEAERDKHRSQPGTSGDSVPAPAPALVETVSFAAGAARNDAGCTAADAENVPTYA
jgi:alpha-tubulin suppressor-like RCC1 family protein